MKSFFLNQYFFIFLMIYTNLIKKYILDDSLRISIAKYNVSWFAIEINNTLT